MSSEARTTSVHIHGHEYRIRSTEDGEFVREVALYVDEVMHRISSRMTSGTASQVAVLAALNIAEELFRERRDGQSVSSQQIDERVRALLKRLEEIAAASPAAARATASEG
jgi:cell division protein ZapA